MESWSVSSRPTISSNSWRLSLANWSNCSRKSGSRKLSCGSSWSSGRRWSAVISNLVRILQPGRMNRGSLQEALKGSGMSNTTQLRETTQTAWKPITKDPATWRAVRPNLTDWGKTRAEFSWEQVREELCRYFPSANIGELAVDRHANGPLRDHVALRWLGRDGRVLETTFGQLRDETNRFANVLRGLGIGKQDRVFALAGRIPSLYTAALGTLKNTSVFCPLFSAFGPEPVRQRLERGNAKVLVTTERLYRRTIESLRPQLPEL